jgi:hypothetical protein
MLTAVNRTVFDLECRRSELMERRRLVCLDLPAAEPDYKSLLEIALARIEREMSEVRIRLSRLPI